MVSALKRYVKMFQGVAIPWFLLAIVMGIAVVNSYVEVGAVTITASIIDSTKNVINTQELVRYVVYLLLYGGLEIANTYISGLAYEKINLGIRVKLWNKMMHLPTGYYDMDNGNELVSRVTTDTDAASYYFRLFISAFTSIYAAFVAFRKLFDFQAVLAAWTLIIIPIGIGIGILYGIMTYHTGAKTKNAFAATMGYLAERVRNFRLIKSFHMEQEERKKADGYFKKQFGAEMLLNLTVAMQVFGIELVSCICIVIAFFAGGKMVAAGTLTTGRLVGFYTLSSLVAIRISQLYIYFGDFTQNNGMLQKVARVLETPVEGEDGYELDVADADIHLEHVSFSYGEVEVLKDVTCTIPKGRVTAVIGTNGAGKSTLLKLLERMYEPTKGAIRFGTTDILEFQTASWRKSFALVAQDKPLMSGTVRENILYGVEREVTEEELVAVAKMANAYEFIMETPGGFDAEVGPDGSNFSGGQQQCIAIARAMMRNPDYLLLDEATSNLDGKSEKNVSEALSHLMKGRTTIMIAHNYSATVSADYIIVLNQGKVEAAGTPEELLATNEYYRTFAKNGKNKMG